MRILNLLAGSATGGGIDVAIGVRPRDADDMT